MARLIARLLTAAAALPIMAAVALTPTPAQADWRRGGYGGYGGYRGYHGWEHRGPGAGAIVGGALLGLGVGALLAAPFYAPPPVVYAPPPAYYPPPAYATYPPPGYANYPPPAYANYPPPPPPYYYYGR